MKNTIKFLIVLMMCSVAMAVVSITITVPDIYVPDALSLITTFEGVDIRLEVEKHALSPENEIRAMGNSVVPARDPNDSHQDYFKKFNKALLIAAMSALKDHEKQIHDANYYRALPAYDTSVPGGVIE